jgi:hypothetical protein
VLRCGRSLVLLQITLCDGLAPKECKDGAQHQKRPVRDIVTTGANTREHQQETDDAPCHYRDQECHEYHRETRHQSHKRRQFHITCSHSARVKDCCQIKKTKGDQPTHQHLLPTQSGRKQASHKRQQDGRPDHQVKDQAVFQIDDGDENEDRHVGAEQQHVEVQAVAIV